MLFDDESGLLSREQLREEPLSVSELTAQIKSQLESSFAGVWLRGEISNLRIQSSGHAYFTLKDAGSQISAVAFRGMLSRSQVQLREGMQLVVFGDVSVYAPRGNYQIVVRILQEEGVGRLQAEYEKLFRKLEAEGLFAKEKKRPIPRRRDWVGKLYVIPAKVQGVGAADEIVRGIRLAGQLRDLDVLVVGRGGGSLEDLWCFNEETVARAVRASRVPVISAVGHEIDFTLSDFASDLRAETPSAAAEYISSGRLEIVERVENAGSALESAVVAALEDHAQRLDLLESRLESRSPHAQLALMRSRLGLLSHRLVGALTPSLIALRERLGRLNFRLEKQFPARRTELARLHLNQLQARLAASGLDATLKRGFALARDEATGKPLDSAASISLGQKVILQFHDGTTHVEGRDLVG